VPDYSGELNLSGDLSHGKEVYSNVNFIGPLSRFSRQKKIRLPFSRELLLILSGPEPQRSILEKNIKIQLLKSNYSALIVRGVVEEKPIKTHLTDKIAEVNFLTTEDLQEQILNSELVICRAGYSSIMDMTCLNKNAILIPTKGQTEQEYLATYLSNRGLFYSVKEKQFHLEESIKKLRNSNLNELNRQEYNVDFLTEFLSKV